MRIMSGCLGLTSIWGLRMLRNSRVIQHKTRGWQQEAIASRLMCGNFIEVRRRQGVIVYVPFQIGAFPWPVTYS